MPAVGQATQEGVSDFLYTCPVFGLATLQAPDRKTIMIDATYLKAHRTASSLRVKRGMRDA